MMIRIVMDGKVLDEKEKVFDYVKTELDIKPCFANNLDGLWDVLSVYDKELEITLINLDHFIYNLKEYGESFIELFNDLDTENEDITFIIEA